MKNQKAPLIPVTKNSAPPSQQGQQPTVMDWLNEYHARSRRASSDKVAMDEIADKFMNEIIVRDRQIASLEDRLSKFDPAK